MQAIATLIFAAARFSDLPELCDLRHVFTDRYGSSLDLSIINAEVLILNHIVNFFCQFLSSSNLC